MSSNHNAMKYSHQQTIWDNCVRGDSKSVRTPKIRQQDKNKKKNFDNSISSTRVSLQNKSLEFTLLLSTKVDPWPEIFDGAVVKDSEVEKILKFFS